MVFCIQEEHNISQEDLSKPCYKCLKSRTMGCEKELYNNELAFEWRKQPASNLREIKQIVKYICNDIERQNILAKMPLQKSSLTLHPGIYFCWGKRSYVERSSRNEQCSCQQECGSCKAFEATQTKEDALFVEVKRMFKHIIGLLENF